MKKQESTTTDLRNSYTGKYWQRVRMASYRLIKYQGRAVAAAFFFAGFMFMGAPEGVADNYPNGSGSVLLGDENHTDANSNTNVVSGYDNTLVNDSDSNSVTGNTNFLNVSGDNEVDGDDNVLVLSNFNQVNGNDNDLLTASSNEIVGNDN